MSVPSPLTPSVKQVSCPNCAAHLDIRGMGRTTSFGCSYCGSILDIATGDLKIIDEAKKIVSKLKIPLGAKGKLRGITFEVIGYIRRSDYYAEFFWSEYLLFNPYHGFRWLSEYNNHWQFVTPLPYVPDILRNHSHKKKSYRRFSESTAVICEVVGELYWEARRGDLVRTYDFIAPPLGLSLEMSGDEISAAEFEYIGSKELVTAFSLKDDYAGISRSQIGVSLTQSNPYKKGMVPDVIYSILLIVFAIFVQIHSISGTLRRTVFLDELGFTKEVSTTGGSNFNSTTEEGREFITPMFETFSKTTNLEVKSETNLENSWIFLTFTLIGENGLELDEKSLELSYYHGHDSDGSWSEGSMSGSELFSEVPPGKYQIRISSERPNKNIAVPTYSSFRVPEKYKVKVTQDVPYWGNFNIVFFSILAFLIGKIILYASFENKRWSESSPYLEDTSMFDRRIPG